MDCKDRESIVSPRESQSWRRPLLRKGTGGIAHLLGEQVRRDGLGLA